MTWESVLNAATLLAAIGSGLIAGVFFAFSTFVMRALATRPAAEGMAAMQAINVVVINPLFLGVFLGTAVVSLLAAVGAWINTGDRDAIYVLAGAALYVLGMFGVTLAFNVPLNNMLAAVVPSDPCAAAAWTDYAGRWTRWNHVRTAAATAAMAMFILGF